MPARAPSFTPSPDQAAALDYLRESIFEQHQRDEMLAGAAGCGKSTLMDVLMEESPWPVLPCAATGKAKNVLAQKTGRPTFTAHQIAYQGAEEDDEGNLRFWRRQDKSVGAELFAEDPSEAGHRELLKALESGERMLVVLDESSMLDKWLKRDLFKALKARVQVLAVGDHFQIPPVTGRANAGWDLRNARAKLTQVHRQAEGSKILLLVTHIREKKVVPTPELVESFELPVYTDGAIKVARQLAEWHMEGKDFACLLPKNKDRVAMNNLVRRHLDYPGMSEGPQVGERVMILSNNKKAKVCNGEVGIVLDAQHEITFRTQTTYRDLDIWQVVVDLGDGPKIVRICLQAWADKWLAGQPDKKMRDALWSTKTVARRGSYLEKLVGMAPASAMTIHKSQGSQYPYLYVVLDDAAWMGPEEANLWYTAFSRGSGEVRTVLGRSYKRRR